MSQASFFIFDKSDLKEYVEALRTPFKGSSKAAIAKHPTTIFRNAKCEQPPVFRGSGLVLAYEMPQFLKHLSLNWDDFVSKKVVYDDELMLSAEFFATPKVKKFCEALDEILDDPKLERQIIKFLQKYPKGEPRSHPDLSHKAVFDALVLLRYWLSRVTSKKYGELYITF